MPHHFSRPLATCLLAGVLLASAPAFAGFEDGNAAWQKGDYATALKEFTAAAKAGDADASYRLGTMYANGEGTPRNLYLAWQYFHQAVERGNLTAVAEMGDLSDYFDLYLFSHEVPAPGKRGAALKRLQRAAAKGNGNALNDLALMYKQGDGVRQDMKKALEYLNQAVAKNNPYALTNLGLMYGKGDGVEADPERAVSLYKQAVALGHPRAYTLLARRLMDGDGIVRDVNTAVDYYRKAAKSGDTRAQLAFADLLRRGVDKTVPVNLEQAVHWYEQAAKAGNFAARMVLADMFETGQGVSANPAQAVYWYEQAAIGNQSAEARYKLAYIYDKGLGTLKPNPELAARWYKEGATHNDTQAQLRLAELYAAGQGIKQSADQAGRWLARAAAGCCGMPPLGKMIEKSAVFSKLSDPAKRQLIQRAAREGNADAQTILGNWYVHGEMGLKANPRTARQWLQRAAKQDYAPAQKALDALDGKPDNKQPPKPNAKKQHLPAPQTGAAHEHQHAQPSKP